MKAEHFKERQIEIDGWPVKLTSYRLGEKFICEADNVSPGACLARFKSVSPEDAEAQAISKAKHMLSKTRRRDI